MGSQAVSTANREAAEILAALTRAVPDFPQPGILFRDLTPVLADDRGFAVVTDALSLYSSTPTRQKEILAARYTAGEGGHRRRGVRASGRRGFGWGRGRASGHRV